MVYGRHVGEGTSSSSSCPISSSDLAPHAGRALTGPPPPQLAVRAVSFSAPMPLAFSDGTLRGHLERVGLGFSARAMAAFQAEPSSPQQELVQAIRAVEHGLDPCL